MKPYRVLVIDDQRESREQAYRRVFESPEAGLSLEFLDHPDRLVDGVDGFDAYLVDVFLDQHPWHHHGEEVVRRYLRRDGRPLGPVVLVTRHWDAERESALADIITKTATLPDGQVRLLYTYSDIERATKGAEPRAANRIATQLRLVLDQWHDRVRLPRPDGAPLVLLHLADSLLVATETRGLVNPARLFSRFREFGVVPHLILLSGGCSRSGLPSEFTECEVSLRTLLGNSAIQLRHHVFGVPGIADITQGLNEPSGGRAGELRPYRLAPWRDFASRALGNPPAATFDGSYWTSDRFISDGVELIGMGTREVSGEEGVRDALARVAVRRSAEELRVLLVAGTTHLGAGAGPDGASADPLREAIAEGGVDIVVSRGGDVWWSGVHNCGAHDVVEVTAPVDHALIAQERAIGQVIVVHTEGGRFSTVSVREVRLTATGSPQLGAARDHRLTSPRGATEAAITEAPAADEGTTEGVSPSPISACDVPARRRILVLATEWKSGHGGISTFNRGLCRALADQGVEVVCCVSEPGAADEDSAREARVRLVRPGAPVKVDPQFALAIAPKGLGPVSAVIGHDRHSGPQAAILADTLGVPFVFFVHTSPTELEFEKSRGGDPGRRAEEKLAQQLELAERALLVVTVGPRLLEQFRTQVSALERRPPIIRFDPGVNPKAFSDDELPPIAEVLLFGRMEDATLKGLELAAGALRKAADSIVDLDRLRFIVRGVEVGQTKEVQEHVRGLLPSGLGVRAFEFTPASETIRRDIRRASLVLVPSIEEGFGLTGLESIEIGTPVLVSKRSGLAAYLEEHCSEHALHHIAAVTGDMERDTSVWAGHLNRMIMERQEMRRRVRAVAEALHRLDLWNESARSLLAALALAERDQR